jgi:uncharacterized protein
MAGTAKRTLDRRAIFTALRARSDLLNKHAVKRVGLFGSFATGTQSAKSDIDLLVEFERPTYENFVGLARDLKKLFGRRVEIMTPGGLASIRIASIAADIRKSLIYE